MTGTVKTLVAFLFLLGVSAFGYSGSLVEVSRAPTKAAAMVAARFQNFQLGEAKPVSVELGVTDLDLETKRKGLLKTNTAALGPNVVLREGEARRDQIHDLLMRIATASYIGAPNSIAAAFHDSNPLRKAFLNTTTTSQYGPTRFVVADDGVAIVTIPGDLTAQKRHDALAKVADRYVTQVGERPRMLAVFEFCYDDLDHALTVASEMVGSALFQYDDGVGSIPVFATLALSEVIEGSELFSAEYGYVERTVNSKEDLAAFLEATNDLVGANKVTKGGNSALELSGRNYEAREYGRTTAEHVATLWNAYREIDLVQSEFSRELNDLAREFAKKKLRDNIEASVSSGAISKDVLELFDLHSSGGAGSSFSADIQRSFGELVSKAQKDVFSLLEEFQSIHGTCEWQFQSFNVSEARAGRGTTALLENRFFMDLHEAYAELRDGLDLRERSLLRGSVGFSLDTAYDFKVLRSTFARFMATDRTGVADVVRPFETYVSGQLNKQSAKFLLCALQQFQDAEADEIFKQVSRILQDPARFQIARYDGGIFGTEVGQILFLTDLMAKLLDMDFNGLFGGYFPEGAGSWTPSAYNNPPVHYLRQLEKLPGTRIWFGLRHGTHLIETDGALRFSDIVTRVYARSHGTLRSERERQPGFLAERFVGWFNNHYETVASAEPRYDQLNQIMKWSLALDVMRGNGHSFGFLSDVPVRDNLWFPDWALNEGEKGAKAWAACFHDRGRYRNRVETLPVFHMGWNGAPETWCGGIDSGTATRIWSFSGGVSLPRATVSKGTSSVAKVPPSARRGSTLGDTLKVDDNGIKYAKPPQYNQRQEIAISRLDHAGLIHVKREAFPVKQTRRGKWVEAKGEIVFNRGESIETRALASEEVIDFSAYRLGRTETRVGVAETPVGRVAVELDTTVARAAITPETLLLAENLSHRLSRLDFAIWRRIVQQEPSVAATFQDGKTLYLRFRGERDGWVRFERQVDPQVHTPELALARGSNRKGALDSLLGEPSVILIIKATPEEVAARASSKNGIMVIRTPRDDGSFNIDIRGPPKGPPPSTNTASTAGGRDNGRINLLVGYRKDGQTTLQPTGKTGRKISGEELDLAILYMNRNTLPRNSSVLSLPKNFDGGSAIADLYRNREAAFSLSLHSPEAAKQLAQNRAARLETTINSLKAGDFTTARQLRRDLHRDFGDMLPTEKRLIAAERHAAATSQQIGLTRDAAKDIAVMIRAGEGKQALAKRMVDDLMNMADSSPEKANRTFQKYRAFMMETGGRSGEAGARVFSDGNKLYARWACQVERMTPASAHADEARAFYLDTRLGPEFELGGWPPSVPGLLYLKVSASAESQARRLARLRPDQIWLGDAARFRIHSRDTVPSIANAIKTPEGRAALTSYLEDLGSIGLGGSEDGGDETPSPIPVFVTNEDDIEGSCSARAMAELAAPVEAE